MENDIELITINALSRFSFLIPAYQRGYRWTPQEVEDLLNDIEEFTPKEIRGTDNKTWYCLQPLVVKKKEGNIYEVIDGQQRLTTIYLILYYLNQYFIPEQREKLFEIEYQTRKASKEFLMHPEQNNNDNIDFYYIHKAYEKIKSWFESKSKLTFNRLEYSSKLQFYTKVIWYEIKDENPAMVFSRMNIGKISLTNAELIRALFLNKSNFSLDDTVTHMRQVEIANEWDDIERALQSDKLWYFLSSEQKEDNRIEYIFNMMNDLSGEGEYSVFRYFNTKLHNSKGSEMSEEWEEVQRYYQRLIEWYNDRELYHKIGFLLTAENTKGKSKGQYETVKRLYKESSSMRKSEFKNELDNEIKNLYRKVKLFELDYDEKATRSVLLLYNILTMLQNDCDSSYFPFDEFKLNEWNIEHIASKKDATEIPERNRKEWLNEVSEYIDIEQQDGKELKRRINDFCKNERYKDNNYFKVLFDDITDHFNKYWDEDPDVDGITNLALLDEKTNKAYKNAVFPVKRAYIIDRDKAGKFVPLCTKNVFLKYFSDYPPKVSFWTKEDREKYEQDLNRVLSKYVGVQNNG